MRALVQRSLNSSVKVDDKIVGQINKGLVVLVGFTDTDSSKEIDYIIDKIINLRIFDDEDGIMNKSVLDINGSILSISQFTLYADASKGRRPSYVKAMKNGDASKLYDKFNEKLKERINVEMGVFGADMKVNIINDGPVTIMLESK
ncbi:MAG: D-aminoacyl-tRNA deacylase [Bacilli bacterium]|nr:D-aminoacyl-tRNA deacylase [Bacilli bacterium]